MKTVSMRPQDVERSWWLIDAENKTLGRLATEVASRLRGKHKPQYTPHVDTGDYIIVINAEKVRVTGNKETGKIYYRHSGYPGGIRATSVATMREQHPERLIEKAVKGMLPKNPLGRAMFRKLKVYAGSDHPHTAQQPEILEVSA
jgi:large subunit ribosomal protein L13